MQCLAQHKLGLVGFVIAPHPLETADVGWFAADALPEATAGAQWWGPMAFAIMGGLLVATLLTLVLLPVLYVIVFGNEKAAPAGPASDAVR